MEKIKKNIKKPELKAPIYQLLVVIVNRGKGSEVTDFLKSLKVEINIVGFGSGTAPSGLANLLGLYSKEKEIVFAVIKLKNSDKILDGLEDKILFQEKNAGIAFTIPLKSMTNQTINIIK